DLAVATHERGAVLRREIEPVHVLAAPLRHRIEAEVAPRRNLREEPRRGDLLHLLLERGLPSARGGLDATRLQPARRMTRELVGAELDDGEIGVRRAERRAERRPREDGLRGA